MVPVDTEPVICQSAQDRKSYLLLLISRLSRQGRLQKKVKRLSTPIRVRMTGLDPVFGMEFSTILSLGQGFEK